MYRHFYVRETDGAYVTIDTDAEHCTSTPDGCVWVATQPSKAAPKPEYSPYGVENPDTDVPF